MDKRYNIAKEYCGYAKPREAPLVPLMIVLWGAKT